MSSVCSVTIGGAIAGLAGSFRMTSLLKARSFERAIREPGDSDVLRVEDASVLAMARSWFNVGCCVRSTFGFEGVCNG